jgi:tetratricopeptide (TPR) repeat protein
VLFALPCLAQEDEFAKAVLFGKKFFDLKEYTSAYEQFAKADALRPDDPAVLYDMALVLAKAGRYAEAQVKADRYNQIHPNGVEKPNVQKLQLELEFQRELQKKRQAEHDYQELFNRGRFLFGKNDLDGALKTFQEAEQQRPSDAAAVYNQALIYEKQGSFEKAVERFRRYSELESDPAHKSGLDQRVFAMETEIEDMKTKIVCPFCGHRMPSNAMWCPRDWHGPYATASAIWNSRPCVEGATATRSTFYADNRLAKNDSLPCLTQTGTMRESLRYTPSRQRAIQDARKAEGWTYKGDVIQGWTDRQGNEVRFVHGADHLERIISVSTGEVLEFDAHKSGDVWLLDREDVIIEGQKYTSRYTYDDKNRIALQHVSFQNVNACNHLITEVADFVYQNDALTAVNVKGGYDGFASEGQPRTDWQATVTYAYDGNGRVAKEDLAVTSFVKTYANRPHGALRDETSKLYTSMRPKKPVENVLRSGDLCATSGSLMLANLIDLRPFYAMSPNLSIALPIGVTRASVAFTYPESYRLPR